MHTDETGRARKSSILIIDDLADNLRLLRRMLASRGHLVHPVTSGVAALRLLESRTPDLVLLDIVMPEMNGFEVCRRIKEDRRLHDIPVIFLSGIEGVSDKVKGFQAGGVDYIVKPFQREEVIARIETHLLLHDLQKRLEQRVEQRTAELAAAYSALHQSEERFRSLYHDTPSTYLMVIPDGVVRLINRFGQTQLGYEASEVIGLPVLQLLPDDDRDKAATQLSQCTASPGQVFYWELRMIRKDGALIWMKATARAVYDQEGAMAVLMVCEDITERRIAEERIHYLAHHDSLTGLPNRVLMKDRLEQSIAQARRADQPVAILFLDLDGFKHINDSLNHHIGDRLLCAVANRLQDCLRKGDSIARVGGDEFVLVLPAPTDSQAAAHVARKILDALDDDFAIAGHKLHISASIGISLFPTDGTDTESMQRAADTAMYYAKARGRGTFQFFTPALNAAAQNRLTVETQLRQALAEGQFELYYQPQVNIETGQVFSAEALLRWRQPGKDPTMCCEFITVAEDSGLILPIGLWALREACLQLRRWHMEGYTDMHIAVNLSARQFYQPRLYDTVMEVLRDTGLPPSALELEITESVFVQQNDENLALLHQLSAAGVQLSLDDFGTGYSSLSYLQRFPFHALKIDRAFVNGIDRNANQTALVAAIIAMAQSLHLRVIAEGVENLEQASFLKNHGCLVAQGYYYGKPVPAAVFSEVLRTKPRGIRQSYGVS
jgi:diguanylate cyclase (GGDEF)-like protein/PAS domain S-box-containing protein